MKVACDTSLTQRVKRFVEGARGGLDDLREARRTRLKQDTQRFFGGSKQGLAVLGPVVAELDRHLARRFSVFNLDRFHPPGSASYFHLDENRMSDVLADLLQPNSVHGQGDLFLSALLGHLRDDEVTHAAMKRILPADPTWPDTIVTREALTTHSIRASNKRMDIVISMTMGGESVAIAIENKPKAEDEPAQLDVYADHLQRKYDGRYLLLYLTPYGNPPGHESLSPDRQRDLVEKGRFACVKLDQWSKGWMLEAESQVKAAYVQRFVADFRQAVVRKYMDSEAQLGPIAFLE